MHESTVIHYDAPEYELVEHTILWCAMRVVVHVRHKVAASWDNTHDCPAGHEYDDSYGEIIKLVVALDDVEITNGFNQVPERGLFDHIEWEMNKTARCTYDLIDDIEVEYE